MTMHLRLFPPSLRLSGVVVLCALVLASCGPAANQTATKANPYDQAKDAFKSGDLDRALDLTDDLAISSSSSEYAGRARMLRAVIYAGEMKSAKELAEAYAKGADKSKNPRFQTEYRHLRGDNLQAAAKAALNVAETAHQIAPNGKIPGELTLEASFPATEGPTQVKELALVVEGGWLEPDQQQTAAAAALRKGVDDALADAVSGDRAKARDALSGGSVKLTGTAAALFLAHELAAGAVVFDRHHGRDPQRLLTLCDEGDQTVEAALAGLKQSPNKDQEKAAAKLQAKFTDLRKDK